MLAADFDQKWPLDCFLLLPWNPRRARRVPAAATTHILKRLGEINNEQAVGLFLRKTESQKLHSQVVEMEARILFLPHEARIPQSHKTINNKRMDDAWHHHQRSAPELGRQRRVEPS